MNFKNDLMTLRDAQLKLAGAQATLAEESRLYIQVKADVSAAKEAIEILQEAAQATQQRVHERISSFVSQALQIVFGDKYEFRILFQSQRKQTEAKLELLYEGEPMDPLTSTGGGVVDVVAFALRLACLTLSRPAARKLLVLDEPFKFVSVDRLPAVRQMLEELSQQAGIQIVMVTHLPALAVGHVIEIKE
jgi:DNA repair exonuclease SbcCD ATPase subunit